MTNWEKVQEVLGIPEGVIPYPPCDMVSCWGVHCIDCPFDEHFYWDNEYKPKSKGEVEE